MPGIVITPGLTQDDLLAQYRAVSGNPNATADDMFTNVMGSKPTLTQVQALIPAAPSVMPAAEQTAAAIGNPAAYASQDHVHPRLTSATGSTTNPVIASGTATVTFTRKFDVEPAVTVLPVGVTTEPVIFGVDSFVKDASNKFVGCVVRCWRIIAQSLSAVTVAGVSVTAGGQTVSVATAGSAGQRYSVIALQAS